MAETRGVEERYQYGDRALSRSPFLFRAYRARGRFVGEAGGGRWHNAAIAIW